MGCTTGPTCALLVEAGDLVVVDGSRGGRSTAASADVDASGGADTGRSEVSRMHPATTIPAMSDTKARALKR
jgi:hypothetical protein